ncbi:MAG: class I SAM-dependent methyltransferase [Planctomycetes bacterium]|nr:class I SAM-dependent methyltransferase [Planctomycetota bacterium]
MLMLDPDQYDAVADQGFEDHACWPITETLLDLTRIGQGSRLLDVACGTGIVSRRAASRIGPDGRALGIDLSTGRLRQARLLAARAGLAQVAFEAMDACDLEFPPSSFDAVVAQFPHLPDRAACLRGALRALKPGGRMAIGNGGGGAPSWPTKHAPDFPGPSEAVIDGVFSNLLGEMLPAAAAPVSHGFIQPMISAPGDELMQAGFSEVELWSCAHTAVFTRADDLYAFEATRNSSFRTRAATLDQHAIEEFRGRFIAEAGRRLELYGLLGATSGALIAAGTKPR